LAETPPEQVVGYEPTDEVSVYVVEHVGAVPNEAADCPYTNPSYEAEIAGTTAPKITEADDAETVSGALATVNVIVVELSL
jgi:hypothetical protein